MSRKTRIGAGGRVAEPNERQIHQVHHGSVRKQKIEILRAALIEGEQSGASTPFDIEAFIARKRRKTRAGDKTVR